MKAALTNLCLIILCVKNNENLYFSSIYIFICMCFAHWKILFNISKTLCKTKEKLIWFGAYVLEYSIAYYYIKAKDVC